ncbi:MAG: glycosyltransferase family 2 protein, partial [Solirubrobacterales bacterium]|nr:glycosyltransferase family 2 protein [Solirubrobacterales bacterium]
PLEARLLAGPAPGASAARNAGWRAATTDLVLFLGDDILASKRLLAEHLAFHERHREPELGALGHVRWARELQVTPFMRWLEHGTQFDFHSIRGEAGWGNFYTANVSLKRVMLERTGGFDEERFPFLYEDTDLGYRLREHGFRLLYHRRAEGEHLHPTTLEDWQGRMGAIARAERAWIALHPDHRPHFHDRLAEAAAWPPTRGRIALVGLRLVPPRTPILGPWISERASVHYRQQLAPAFMAAWAAAAQDDARERSTSSGGSPPSGP